MPFAPVKTSPYGTRKARGRDRHLWPASWWKRLCEQAQHDWECEGWRDVSPGCREMIAGFNADAEARSKAGGER